MQKLTLTIAAIVGLTYTVLAGEGPAAAEKALAEKYPQAEEITWQKESANNYQAAFLYSGVNIWVNFNEDGKVLQTKTTIPVAQVPTLLFDFIKKSYPGGTVTGAAKIEKPSIDALLYELEIKSDKGVTKAILNDRGAVIK